jgi:hypothetical protein
VPKTTSATAKIIVDAIRTRCKYIANNRANKVETRFLWFLLIWPDKGAEAGTALKSVRTYIQWGPFNRLP